MFEIGLYNYKDISDIVIYMLPEILIISFIMGNEIMLRLNGIYDKNEGHHETIFEGLERWKC